MEIPDNLKSLYRHWGDHTKVPTTELNGELMVDIERFVKERMRVWEQKVVGAAPPYTQDPILAQYRFCNIYRELDRQTIAFHTLLTPLRNDFPLWLLNMFYCRMVANIDTINHVGLLSYDAGENEVFYERLMDSPRPRYGTPYIFPVSVIMRGPTPTRELFIAQHLPKVMQSIAGEIQAWNKKSVYDGVRAVLPRFGYPLSFHWTEVLIDVAYQYPERIDLYARFPIGPGSAPTMERINPSVDPTLLVEELSHTHLDTGLTYNGRAVQLSAENWEGIGCEYRKYTNLKSGRGRRRNFKKPSPSPVESALPGFQ